MEEDKFGNTCNLTEEDMHKLKEIQEDSYKITPIREPTQGWKCPVCGAVMSPHTTSCINCSGNYIPYYPYYPFYPYYPQYPGTPYPWPSWPTYPIIVC